MEININLFCVLEPETDTVATGAATLDGNNFHRPFLKDDVKTIGSGQV